jgi:hypothetical protein
MKFFMIDGSRKEFQSAEDVAAEDLIVEVPE